MVVSQKWLVYNGKSYWNGWFGGTPILGSFIYQWLINHLVTISNPFRQLCLRKYAPTLDDKLITLATKLIFGGIPKLGHSWYTSHMISPLISHQITIEYLISLLTRKKDDPTTTWICSPKTKSLNRFLISTGFPNKPNHRLSWFPTKPFIYSGFSYIRFPIQSHLTMINHHKWVDIAINNCEVPIKTSIYSGFSHF